VGRLAQTLKLQNSDKNIEMKKEDRRTEPRSTMQNALDLCGWKQIENKSTYLMQDFVHPQRLYQVHPSFALLSLVSRCPPSHTVNKHAELAAVMHLGHGSAEPRGKMPEPGQSCQKNKRMVITAPDFSI
jgi:hypothetical protein